MSFFERVKDFFSRLFAEKKANTIFIIAMILIIVVCLVFMIIKIVPSCEGQDEYADASGQFTTEQTPDTVNIVIETKAPTLGEILSTTAQPDDTGNADPSAQPTADGATPQPGESQEPTKKPTAEPDPYAGKKAADYVPRTKSIDFGGLSNVNSDIFAWLYLQDTVIDYPVLLSPVEDPGFYLTHLYDKSENITGSLFVNPGTDTELGARNTLIHGHRMNAGTMFGSLSKYKKQTYYEGNPIIQLYTEGGQNYFICIFAAYEDDITTNHTVFSDDSDFQSYLDRCMRKSVIDTIVTPTVNDRIVTLSTCVVGNDTVRMIVQGVLRPMN